MGLIFVKTADGKQKPSLFVWLLVLVVLLGGSLFIVTNKRTTGLEELHGNSRAQKQAEAPSPINKKETIKSSQAGMDAETQNAMEAQIKKETEENGGYLAPQRTDEIQRKYEAEYEQKQSANFRPTVTQRLGEMGKTNATPAPPKPAQPKKSASSGRYKTLAERMEADGIKPNQRGNSGGTDFKQPTNISKNQVDTNTIRSDTPTGPNWSKSTNLLPLGTFIPCVLDGDVVTTDLTSHVWANVVLDTTFRRQLQLPKGIVKIRGKTASEPVQNLVDIFFDTMVFSDGTELPISGFAYAALDPRFPNRFKARGIPGKMIVPPYFVKLQSLIYSAALGASDAYIQNYLNENTTTQSTFTTVPTIDPNTGQVSNQIQQTQGQPVNNQIGATIGLSAGQAALEDLVTEAKKDLEKYRPYVTIEKGTPLYVQLDTTVDVNTRKINGTAIAKEAELQRNLALSAKGVPMPKTTEIYPPGDARAKYTGYDPSTGTSSTAANATSPGVQEATNQFLNQLQPNSQQAAALSQAEAGVAAARSGQTGTGNAAALQQLLQSIGTANANK